jgi:nucleotide-binding universal stress UspA family protein
MITKILVALDGSEHAEKTLDFALDLAEQYSALVMLVSVVHLPPMMDAYAAAPPYGFPLPNTAYEYKKSLEDFHKRVLSDALLKTSKTRPNLKVSTRLLEGRPSDRIVEMAEKENFDIIVIGHRGMGRIKEFLLGSVADRVADEATCPVLITK